MTDQERIDRLADRIRSFRIEVAGGGELRGGFGDIPDKSVTLEHLQKAFGEFRLEGNKGIQASGSIEHGYNLFGNPTEAGEVPGFPGGIVPPTGACCNGTDCSIQTQSDCETSGGTYQGDSTRCDPNPCTGTTTGACCFDDGSCFIETSSDCSAAGGHYQGDGTTCDPNPCVDCGPNTITLCKCGFNALDLSPGKWLTRTSHVVRTEDREPPFLHCTSDWDLTTIESKTLDGSYVCGDQPIQCSGTQTVTDFSGTFSCTWTPVGGVCVCDSLGNLLFCNNNCTDPNVDVTATSPTHGEATCDASVPNYTCTLTRTVDLSDEYTTAMLISNAESLFTLTYGGCPSGCTFHAELDGDERCVTITCVQV